MSSNGWHPTIATHMTSVYLLETFNEIQYTHRVGGNRNRSSQSTNTGQKSIETVFSIVICRQSGDK